MWQSAIHPTTGQHDQRRQNNIYVYPEIGAARPAMDQCKGMAVQMNAGNLDHVLLDDMNHEFTIGANPAGGGDAPGGSVEGTSPIDSYADLVAEYGQNGDGFV